jgi:hypothetical protein
MQYYIQGVHIKISYFTIKLHSNIHLTYYSYNNKKDLKLNLDRASGGQLIKIGYLLKITTKSIGNNRVQPMESAKEGVVYFALGNRLIKRGTLKVQYFKYRKRKDLADWIISMSLVYPIGWCIDFGLNQ